ncbi:MAG: hypothetical protein N3C12_10440 [Candidatus Binatia bacterium]|nr:hypothetical protein [Candidatus Binatia bacterium]
MAENSSTNFERKAPSPAQETAADARSAESRLNRWRAQLLSFRAEPQQFEKWLDRLLLLGLVTTLAIVFYIFFLSG